VSWAISVLHRGRVSEEFGTCPIKHMLSLLCGCLPVYHEICMRSVNFVRLCITHWNTFVKFITWYSIFYGRFSSPAARSMLYCAQRYSCAVEDLLFTCSTCNVVDSRVCERFCNEQLAYWGYCKNVQWLRRPGSLA